MTTPWRASDPDISCCTVRGGQFERYWINYLGAVVANKSQNDPAESSDQRSSHLDSDREFEGVQPEIALMIIPFDSQNRLQVATGYGGRTRVRNVTGLHLQRFMVSGSPPACPKAVVTARRGISQIHSTKAYFPLDR